MNRRGPDFSPAGVFGAARTGSANKLVGMELLDFEDNGTEIEVLDGQVSVEELLAELGFAWHPAAAGGAGAGTHFSQPALF